MTTYSPQSAETEVKTCLLTNLLPPDLQADRSQQARALLERMEAGLQDAGMNFSHVVRTWFYLDNILDWYGPFNAVRDKFFTERGIFKGLVPASTGVGMSNAAGAAITGAVLAVKPLTPDVKIFAVPSPLQCPALDYKSSFSRAVEVQTSRERRLYISGTASIAPDGKTAHLDDVDKQIELTMDVVKAILESRKMNWGDTADAVAYFKDIKDLPRFESYCRARNLTKLPIKPVPATICRGDLLFEVELEAVAPTGDRTVS
jgi:enamine deaminase RidA (YjgF/YER057c/UK114 family)